MSDVRLIDANALMKNIGKIPQLRGITYGRMKKAVEETPTFEAVPVVHAKWEIVHGMINPKYSGRKRCTRCGDISPNDMCGREMLTDYCPNCGAKMDGVRKNELLA